MLALSNNNGTLTWNGEEVGGSGGDIYLDESLFNVGVGTYAFEDNSSGARNSALGFGAFSNNTTGDDNVALGYAASIKHNRK